MKEYLFLCKIHTIDWENIEDELNGVFFVKASANDVKQANKDIDNKLNELNVKLPEDTILSNSGLYRNNIDINNYIKLSDLEIENIPYS